jgi:hypothetical protein
MAKDRQKKAFSVDRKFSGARKSLFAPPDYFLTSEKAFFQLGKIFSRRKKPFFTVRKFSGGAKSLFLPSENFPETQKAFFHRQIYFRSQKKPFSGSRKFSAHRKSFFRRYAEDPFRDRREKTSRRRKRNVVTVGKPSTAHSQADSLDHALMLAPIEGFEAENPKFPARHRLFFQKKPGFRE